MKKLGYWFILHTMFVPCIIMGLVSLFEIDIVTVFVGPAIAGMWMLLVGGVYAKKIIKLKREHHKENFHDNHSE